MTILATRPARVLVLALVGIALVLTGCSSPQNEAVAPEAKPVDSAMGPYSQGVTVWFDRTGYTLESVEVSQPPSPIPGSEPTPTADSMTVSATFAFTGANTNPAPAGGFFYPDVSALVDGETLSISNTMSMQVDSEAPPGYTPKQTLTFFVPRASDSLVLRVTPKADPYRTADFRLW